MEIKIKWVGNDSRLSFLNFITGFQVPAHFSVITIDLILGMFNWVVQ